MLLFHNRTARIQSKRQESLRNSQGQTALSDRWPGEFPGQGFPFPSPFPLRSGSPISFWLPAKQICIFSALLDRRKYGFSRKRGHHLAGNGEGGFVGCS